MMSNQCCCRGLMFTGCMYSHSVIAICKPCVEYDLSCRLSADAGVFTQVKAKPHAATTDRSVKRLLI